MRTKLFAILLALLFVLGAFSMVAAAADERRNSVPVGLAMTVKEQGGEGPAVSISTKDMDSTHLYDFKAVLRVGDIWDQIVAWYNFGEKRIENSSLPDAEKTALKAAYDAAVISGHFTVEIEFPEEFDVSALADYIDEDRKDMYGFGDDAKLQFEEVSRKHTDSTITIEIKVKDGLTAGDLSQNYKTYLKALEFEVKDVHLKDGTTVGDDPYVVYGKMTGDTYMPFRSFTADDTHVHYSTVKAKVTIQPYTADEHTDEGTQKTWDIVYDDTVVVMNEEERGDRDPSYMDAEGGRAEAKAEKEDVEKDTIRNYADEQHIEVVYDVKLRAKEDLRDVTLTPAEAEVEKKGQTKAAQTALDGLIKSKLPNAGDEILAKFFAADMFKSIYKWYHQNPAMITVTENEEVKSTNTLQTITVDYLSEFAGNEHLAELGHGYSFRVFWAHADEGANLLQTNSYTATMLKQVRSQSRAKALTFYVDENNGVIEIYTKQFSDFAIVLAKADPEYESTGGGGSVTEYKLTFNIDGDTTLYNQMYTTGSVKVANLPKPEKDGYTFDGWYLDSARTQKVDANFTVSANTVLYGHFMLDALETEDHFAYVIGYPDHTVRPLNNITREEVAMIFYRLLRDEVRESLETTDNPFPDCDKNSWSSVAISTMAKGGYIAGDTEGNFRPQSPITRAEFATIVTRFATLTAKGDAKFSDIAGHWSEDYVLRATAAGWIAGYEDGTFKPDRYITRAEAMTLINRVLNRAVNAEGLHKDAVYWKDMNGTEWYYFAVEEATNTHAHVRQADGINETWTALTENKWFKTGTYED
ncbi:MAG: S-layer homology domain-containing protein [Clostridia bacterium]|nr:S-layer homology domain-containing protein [Clostridia bacterium]